MELNLTNNYSRAVENTLGMIKDLNPDLGEIVLIKSNNFLGTRIHSMVKEKINSLGDVDLTVIEDFSILELYKIINNLAEKTVIIFIPVFTDRLGEVFVPQDVVRNVASISGKQIYSFWGSFMGKGIIGGEMVDPELSGRVMIRAILDYYHNGRFGREYSNLSRVVDWGGIIHTGIDPLLIPEDLKIINRPVSPLVLYAQEIMFVSIIVITLFLIMILFWLKSVICSRRRIKEQKQKLEEALSEVNKLDGLLPICASCKKIRDSKGYWNEVESYIQNRSEARFSHSLCEECTKKLYGNEKWYKDREKEKKL